MTPQTVLLTTFYCVALASFSTTVPDALVSLMRRTKYNHHASPTHNEGKATNVSVSMYIEGLSSFKAQTMDFHVDIYFQERWIDPRLAHNESSRILVKDVTIFKMMWHPDIYFANARYAAFHDVTSPNFLLWIHQNGTVYYDTRISLTVMCMMDLAKYPLDRQHCKLRILSYAYDEEQLYLTWIDYLPIDRNTEITLPDMYLKEITTGSCNGTYAAGVWSCITAEFSVQREIMHHILQSYIPTGLIVTISWFSFWLDVEAVPGRISLCITTLLTLATQASAARLALPEVSYIKAIDVWMGTCLAFVFGVTIEFTIVNYWARRKAPKEHAEPFCAPDQREGFTILNIFKRARQKVNGPLQPTIEKPIELSPIPRFYPDPMVASASYAGALQRPDDSAKPFISNNNAELEDLSEVWKPRQPLSSEDETLFLTSDLSRDRTMDSGSPTQYETARDRDTQSSPETERSARKRTGRKAAHLSENNPDIPKLFCPPPSGNRKFADSISKLRMLSSPEIYNRNNPRSEPEARKDSVGNLLLRRTASARQRWAEAANRLRLLNNQRNRKSAQNIDIKSRYLFPATFVIFNIIYWIYYLYIA